MKSAKPMRPWGRLLICGGTDFATLGKKLPLPEERPDLLCPHILRPVAEVKFQKICTSNSSNHAVFIDVDGNPFVIGRNNHGQLGYPPSTHPTLHLPSKYGQDAPEELREQPIKTAGTGRSHTILITEKGEAWGSGNGQFGQLGTGSTTEISVWKKIQFSDPKTKIKEVVCGINYSVFLDTRGRIWTCGYGERGVLGIGKTGEHISSAKTGFYEQLEPKKLTGPLEDKKIVGIASGQQHVLAVDDSGCVWGWGFGGLGRLGMGTGDQQDRLVPTLLPQFRPGKGAAKILRAGSTCSQVIDERGQFWLFGKWKNTGDGSAGTPWTFPKMLPEFMGTQCLDVSAGGSSLFCIMEDDSGGTGTYSFGQGAHHGELGLGYSQPRSSPKPSRVTGLDGIEVLHVECGASTTYFLVRPPPDKACSKSTSPTNNLSKPKLQVQKLVDASTSTEKPKRKGPDLSGWGFFADSSDEEDSSKSPAGINKKGSETEADTPRMDDSVTTKDLGVSKTDPDKWADLPRWPPVVDVLEVCMVCKGEEDPLLECEKCEQPFHLTCLNPPLEQVPDGEWFCPNCLPPETPSSKQEKSAKSKRKLSYDSGDQKGTKKKVKV